MPRGKDKVGRIRLHNIHNYTAIQMGHWLSRRSHSQFTLDNIIMGIEYDPENRHHRTKVYNVIAYWRRKSKDVWEWLIESGKIQPQKFAEMWGVFLNSYNRNYRAFYLLYDREEKAYFQPRFTEKEIADQKRVYRHAKSLQTILNEMGIFGETLLATGRPVKEALREADKYTRKYITDHTYEKEES